VPRLAICVQIKMQALEARGSTLLCSSKKKSKHLTANSQPRHVIVILEFTAFYVSNQVFCVKMSNVAAD